VRQPIANSLGRPGGKQNSSQSALAMMQWGYGTSFQLYSSGSDVVLQRSMDGFCEADAHIQSQFRSGTRDVRDIDRRRAIAGFITGKLRCGFAPGDFTDQLRKFPNTDCFIRTDIIDRTTLVGGEQFDQPECQISAVEV